MSALAKMLGRGKSPRAEGKSDDDKPEEDEDVKGKGADDAPAKDDDESAEGKAKKDDKSETRDGAGGDQAADFQRGVQHGREQERERWATVMGGEGAQGREQMAAMLLSAGDAPASDIVASLSRVPKTGGLNSAMETLGNVDLGAGGGEPPKRSLADMQRATFEKEKKQ